jgi:hypothetical protein
MAETTSNVEFARRIHEHGHSTGGHGDRSEWIEILEAIVLAAVAVLTAWSGYQAARWDGKSAASYARASATNVEAQEQLTLAGQEHLYDITTFDSWLGATLRGEHELASRFERRFRPEYAVAFAAWMKTDPFNDPKAPPGPGFMPEYTNTKLARAKELSREAGARYEEGVSTRETGDRYIRITVVLATVLLRREADRSQALVQRHLRPHAEGVEVRPGPGVSAAATRALTRPERFRSRARAGPSW